MQGKQKECRHGCVAAGSNMTSWQMAVTQRASKPACRGQRNAGGGRTAAEHFLHRLLHRILSHSSRRTRQLRWHLLRHRFLRRSASGCCRSRALAARALPPVLIARCLHQLLPLRAKHIALGQKHEPQGGRFGVHHRNVVACTSSSARAMGTCRTMRGRMFFLTCVNALGNTLLEALHVHHRACGAKQGVSGCRGRCSGRHAPFVLKSVTVAMKRSPSRCSSNLQCLRHGGRELWERARMCAARMLAALHAQAAHTRVLEHHRARLATANRNLWLTQLKLSRLAPITGDCQQGAPLACPA